MLQVCLGKKERLWWIAFSSNTSSKRVKRERGQKNPADAIEETVGKDGTYLLENRLTGGSKVGSVYSLVATEKGEKNDKSWI